MCGRFSLATSAEDLASFFGLDAFPPLEPLYNLAPSMPVLVVRHEAKAARREALYMRWGLIPSWAKDPSMGNRMINARSETVSEKPAYRHAFKRRRGLLPVDGFFEWKREKRLKQPYYFKSRAGGPLALAGLWEHWQGADGSEIETCTVLTTEANALMRPIHDRMPVIIAPRDFEAWLDHSHENPDPLKALFAPCPPEWLERYPVSPYVNNPKNQDARCIEAIQIKPVSGPAEQPTLFDL